MIQHTNVETHTVNISKGQEVYSGMTIDNGVTAKSQERYLNSKDYAKLVMGFCRLLQRLPMLYKPMHGWQ